MCSGYVAETVHARSVTVASPAKASTPGSKLNPRCSDVHEPTKKPVADRLQVWRQRTDGMTTNKYMYFIPSLYRHFDVGERRGM